MNTLSTDEAALDVNNKKRKPGYDTKVKAQSAAVATIGEHARDGFEYETFKAGGRWHWRVFDVVKPPTAAEIKAMGGKRAFTKAELARHEQRGAERAAGEGRLRPEGAPDLAQDGDKGRTIDAARGTSLVALAQQISGGMEVTVEVAANPTNDFASLTRTPAENFAAEVAARVPRPAPRKATGAPKAPEASQTPPAPETAPVTPAGAPDTKPDNSDGLDLPEFLKRPKQTEEEKEAVRKKIAKTVGPDRPIKNPPDAKQAKARAEKAKGQSMAFVIKDAIKGGKTDEQALAVLLKVFPSCGYKASDVRWYRRKMEKAGEIKPAAKAKS